MNEHDREFWDTRPALRATVALIGGLASICLGAAAAIVWAVVL